MADFPLVWGIRAVLPPQRGVSLDRLRDDRECLQRVHWRGYSHPHQRLWVLEYAVRRLTVSILRAHDYQTFEAANGGQAIAVVEGQPEPIHLIITDVVMPDMTGRQLAERLRPRMPAMKMLYVSGYSEDLIAGYGVVARDGPFVQKSYSPDLLVAKVREILNLE